MLSHPRPQSAQGADVGSACSQAGRGDLGQPRTPPHPRSKRAQGPASAQADPDMLDFRLQRRRKSPPLHGKEGQAFGVPACLPAHPPRPAWHSPPGSECPQNSPRAHSRMLGQEGAELHRAPALFSSPKSVNSSASARFPGQGHSTGGFGHGAAAAGERGGGVRDR